MVKINLSERNLWRVCILILLTQLEERKKHSSAPSITSNGSRIYVIIIAGYVEIDDVGSLLPFDHQMPLSLSYLLGMRLSDKPDFQSTFFMCDEV